MHELYQVQKDKTHGNEKLKEPLFSNAAQNYKNSIKISAIYFPLALLLFFVIKVVMSLILFSKTSTKKLINLLK